MAIKKLKCVIIGYINNYLNSDGAIGKTSLLISFAKGEFPRDHVPTGIFWYFSFWKL